LRWIYVLTVIIPMILGMITTSAVLTIVVGPPVVVAKPVIPPELVIERYNFTKIDGDIAMILYVYNPGTQGLYIRAVYVNDDLRFSTLKYLGPQSGIEEISFTLPRVRGSMLNVTIIWSPEEGGFRRVELHIPAPPRM